MIKKIVSAIDLGFGFVKHLKYVNSTGEFKPTLFPSIVELAGSKKLGAGHLKERNTIEILHNEALYEVGVDIALTTNGYSSRILNKNYIYSDDYQILMKGALKMMNVSFIDVLVLGAPVNKYEEANEYLKKQWEGEIDIDGDNKVKVKKVMVVPQPLGGFVLHGAQSGNFIKIRPQRNLIIDPGFFTFDWLLVENMTMMEGSGSHEGGMAFFLNNIVSQMGSDAVNLTTMNRVDQYFYNDKPVMYEGKVVDINQYLPKANVVLEKSVQVMMSKLTDIKNIDNIIVIGGAANVYLPHIQKHFAGRHIDVAKGKSFSNLLGYEIIGENFIYGKRR